MEQESEFALQSGGQILVVVARPKLQNEPHQPKWGTTAGHRRRRTSLSLTVSSDTRSGSPPETIAKSSDEYEGKPSKATLQRRRPITAQHSTPFLRQLFLALAFTSNSGEESDKLLFAKRRPHIPDLSKHDVSGAPPPANRLVLPALLRADIPPFRLLETCHFYLVVNLEKLPPAPMLALLATAVLVVSPNGSGGSWFALDARS